MSSLRKLAIEHEMKQTSMNRKALQERLDELQQLIMKSEHPSADPRWLEFKALSEEIVECDVQLQRKAEALRFIVEEYIPDEGASLQ